MAIKINPSLSQKIYSFGSNCVLKDVPLEGATPTSLVDKSGCGNDGTFQGSPTPSQLTSGLWSHSLVAGSSQYIDFGDTQNIGTGDFSFAFWLKTTYEHTTRPIFSKYEGANDRYYCYLYTGDVVKFYARTTADAEISLVAGTTDVHDGVWHLIVIVGDRGTRSYIYVDGADDTDGTPGCTASDADNTGDFYIGKYTTSYMTQQTALFRRFPLVLSTATTLYMYEYEKGYFDSGGHRIKMTP